jgi:hypothetical protein
MKNAFWAAMLGIVMAAALAFTGCGQVAAVPEVIPVEDITGLPELSFIGEEIDLSSAVVLPEDATNKKIVWIDGDTGKTIKDTILTPGKAGTLKLTAKIKNGEAYGKHFTKDFEVEITDEFIPAEGITGVPEWGAPGEPIDLSEVTVVPENATRQTIEWTLVDPGETGVTEDELKDLVLFPLENGTIILMATVTGGANWNPPEDFMSEEIEITVTELAYDEDFVEVAEIDYEVPAELFVRDEIDLSAAAIVPDDATIQTITWTVEDDGGTGVTDENIAEGKFTPAAAGTLVLTAAVENGIGPGEDFTQTFEFVISELVAVTGVSGLPEALLAGMEFDLSAVTAEPPKAASETITWELLDRGSTNAALTGSKLTSASKGTLTLKATAGDFEEVYAVDVQEVLLTRVIGGQETVLDVGTENLAGALDYINANGETGGEYVILIGTDQTIPRYTTPMDTDKMQMKITLRGCVPEASGASRTVSWDGTKIASVSADASEFGLFYIGNFNTLVLDGNITLKGDASGRLTLSEAAPDVNFPMICLLSGNLTMNKGAKITGLNLAAAAYTAHIISAPSDGSGIITLNGAEISGNTAARTLSIAGYYPVVMNEGTKLASNGAYGVYLNNGNATLTMNGGEISGYTASAICANANQTITLNAGKIAGSSGGSSPGSAIYLGNAASRATVVLNGELEITGSIGFTSTPGRLYMTDNFANKSAQPIQVDIHAATSALVSSAWGGDGQAVLRAGPPTGPKDITQTQVDKFTGGKAFYGTAPDFSAITGGAITVNINYEQDVTPSFSTGFAKLSQ